MRLRITALLLTAVLAAGLLSACSSVRAQSVEMEMTLPAQPDNSGANEVSGIDIYTYSANLSEGLTKEQNEVRKSIWKELTGSGNGESVQLEEDMIFYRQVLIEQIRSYGITQAGFSGGRIFLTGRGEEGTVFRYLDPGSGFFEEAYETVPYTGTMTHLWTAPDGNARIRETVSVGGNRELYLETAAGETQQLKLTDEALPGNSLWQCAWSADGSTAFLRLLIPEMNYGENWDEMLADATAMELEALAENLYDGTAYGMNDEETEEPVRESTSEAEDGRMGAGIAGMEEGLREEPESASEPADPLTAAQTVWKVTTGSGSPEISRMQVERAEECPNLFAGDDGKELYAYYDYYSGSSYDALLGIQIKNAEDCRYFDRNQGMDWAGYVSELNGRASLSDGRLIWAYGDRVFSMETDREDAGGEAVTVAEAPDGEWISQMVPEYAADGTVSGYLAMCGESLYRLSGDTQELLYKGDAEQLAVGLYLNRETGEILIHYLDERTAGFDEPAFSLVRLKY